MPHIYIISVTPLAWMRDVVQLGVLHIISDIIHRRRVHRERLGICQNGTGNVAAACVGKTWHDALGIIRVDSGHQGIGGLASSDDIYLTRDVCVLFVCAPEWDRVRVSRWR